MTASGASAHPRVRPPTYRTLVLIGVAVLLVVLALAAGAALTPYILALILAFVLNPAVDWLEKRGLRRGLGTVLLIVGILAAVAAVALLMVDRVIEQASALIASWPQVSSTLIADLQALGLPLGIVDPLVSSIDRLPDVIVNLGPDLLRTAVAAIGSGIVALVTLAGLPFFLYYVLVDRPGLVRGAYSLIPEEYVDSARDISGIANGVFGAWAWSQLLLSLSVSVGMRTHRRRLSAFTLVFALAGCAPTSSGSQTAASVEPSVAPVASPSPSAPAASFPTDLFAGLGDEPVSDELAAELQQVLDTLANGHGLTAAVIAPQGTWNGATGVAAGDRAMVPNDQMSIASITKTPVAAQVMQLVEAGELRLDDLAANRLPTDLDFDTNGATIADLLSMRSGISEYGGDEDELREALLTDPLHVWTLDEKLATVAAERGPVGQEWEYIGSNYLLLGLIIEHVTGRPIVEVLRSGVLTGDEFERLIYQPDERPTDPMALPHGAPADTFEENGGYLPSLANATMFTSEGAMASDSLSLARWFRGLCAGEVVSGASLNEMTDFGKRPEYGLGIIDRRGEYGWDSGALGHTGLARAAALCFQNPGIVVVVLANAEEQVDVDSVAGDLWRAASTR